MGPTISELLQEALTIAEARLTEVAMDNRKLEAQMYICLNVTNKDVVESAGQKAQMNNLAIVITKLKESLWWLK